MRYINIENRGEVKVMSLKKWADKNRMYLKLEEDKPLKCKYIKYEEFVDKANDDKGKIRYFLEVNGNEKILESQSIALAELMSGVNFGAVIVITRRGTGRQTTYEVNDASGQVDKDN